MIGRLVSLILLSRLSVTEMNEMPQQISLTVAKPGDNVTLTCALSERDQGLSYWYKLNFGYMFQTVAEGSFGQISTQFNNSRFSATKVDNVLSLTIRNVSKEDEATYFCQAGSSFSISFINGTLVAVNDPKTQHKFVSVKQTPDVKSVHLGDTMTLQCSLLSENKNVTNQCPDEDKVHWFRGASEAHPGVIYHGSIRNKEHGRCDYSLSKTITKSSDAGTYYCALVTCGEILFGKGTKVEIEESPLVTVLGALLTCSVLINFALILTRKKTQPREHCKGEVEVFTDAEQEKSSGDQISNEEGEDVGLNYVALDFPSRKSSRWKSKKESPECAIYSGIREGQ